MLGAEHLGLHVGVGERRSVAADGDAVARPASTCRSTSHAAALYCSIAPSCARCNGEPHPPGPCPASTASRSPPTSSVATAHRSSSPTPPASSARCTSRSPPGCVIASVSSPSTSAATAFDRPDNGDFDWDRMTLDLLAVADRLGPRRSPGSATRWAAARAARRARAARHVRLARAVRADRVAGRRRVRRWEPDGCTGAQPAAVVSVPRGRAGPLRQSPAAERDAPGRARDLRPRRVRRPARRFGRPGVRSRRRGGTFDSRGRCARRRSPR